MVLKTSEGFYKLNGDNNNTVDVIQNILDGEEDLFK